MRSGAANRHLRKRKPPFPAARFCPYSAFYFFKLSAVLRAASLMLPAASCKSPFALSALPSCSSSLSPLILPAPCFMVPFVGGAFNVFSIHHGTPMFRDIEPTDGRYQCAMTRSRASFDRVVIMSSTRPSQKCSCSGSPLMFWVSRR